MIDPNRRAMQTFLEAWGPEFEKSIEMFTGQSVKIESDENAGPAELPDAETSLLWQGQTFERGDTGTVWIGTPVDLYTALMQATAEDSEGNQALYREVLRQSMEGAAHLLSAGRTPRITCKESIEDRAPESADLAWIENAWIVNSDGQRFQMTVAFQPG